MSKRFKFLAEAAKKAIPGVVYVESIQRIHERNLKTEKVQVNGSGFITSHVVAACSCHS